MLTQSDIAVDMIEGTTAIAAYLNKTPRQVYHLCETRQIPAFKLGGKWHLRRSTYAAFLAKREAEVGVM